MKKLIIIFLLFYSVANAQFSNPFDFFAKKKVTAVVTPTYCQRAIDFFARVTTAGKTLTDAQKSWYNDSLFQPLIDSGLISTTRAGDSIVCLYSLGKIHSGDTVVSNMNLLADQYNCIHYGTFYYSDSAGRSNGSTGYLKSFFNPKTDSSIMKLNSAGIFSYSLTNISNDSYGDFYCSEAGVSDVALVPWVSDNSSVVDINYPAVGYVVTDTATVSRGIFSSSRQAINVVVSLRHGILINVNTFVPSVVLPNAIFMTGKIARWFVFFGATSGLSIDKQQKLKNILNNSQRGYGHNVY